MGLTMRDSMHTTTHMYTCTSTNTRACLIHSAIVHTMNKRAHFYALMQAGYVLHSLERSECRIVGQCCSNVLRSLIAYEVSLKAVRACVCEKTDTAHVRSS
jgi:hypothetical protein